jgi:N-acetylneuraminate synthase/N,N'-diacetyllegionaminate synthase
MVIAEIGVNHDGSVERAIELVHHACAAGADAVKLQVFRAHSLMHPACRFAQYQEQRAAESNPAAMLKRYELSDDALCRIIQAIRELRLTPIATPFSPDDVDVIEQLKIATIKIASPDLVNQPLLARAAGTGTPLIVSTGAATIDEVEQTVAWLRQWKSSFALLHCVSSYPTSATQAHLRWIEQLSTLGVPVGYSDHTTEPLAGALAVAAGACIIEKHLTYDRAAAGPDHSSSADPSEFAEYVRLIRRAETMRGTSAKRVLEIEQDVRTVSRQSLVLARDVEADEVIRMSDLTVQRPGTGIAAADISLVAGRSAKSPLRKGTMLQWNMLRDAA